MRRLLLTAVLIAAGLIAILPGVSGATILVDPPTVPVGRDTTFTVRIQSLREGAATHAVKIVVPDDTTVGAQQPPPFGWSRDPLSRDGRVVGVFYKGGIMPFGTHIDFRIVARPEVAGRTLWVAEQYYDDGFVEQLTLFPNEPIPEGSEADGPGAVVQVDDPNDVAVSAPASEAVTPVLDAPRTVVTTSGDSRGIAWVLGILLLFGALLSFAAALFFLLRDDDPLRRTA